MIVIFFFLILINWYELFNLFQQAHYDVLFFTRKLSKHHPKLLYPCLFLIPFSYFENIFHGILLILIAFGKIFFIMKTEKVHLKLTKRLGRLLIPSVAISFCSLFVLKGYVVYLLCLPLMLLLYYVFIPVEKRINSYYIKKAQEKLTRTKGIKIAITGSYGKTSTKHYLGEILKNQYLVSYSPESYNTPLGIARFINETNLEFADFILYEFGARKKGDIKELTQLYPYQYAVLTEVGPMHLDTFISEETILKEKFEIVQGLPENGIAILNYENEKIRNYPVKCKVISYGIHYGRYQARNIYCDYHKTSFDCFLDNHFLCAIETKLLGKQSVLNLMPSIIFATLYQLDYNVLSFLNPVKNRLSLRKVLDYYVLEDAYNSNPEGLSYALEVLKTFEGRKYMITPGFVEMKDILESIKKNYVEKILQAVDVLIFERNSFTLSLANEFKDSIELYYVDSFKEGYQLFSQIKTSNAMLLIENDLPDIY